MMMMTTLVTGERKNREISFQHTAVLVVTEMRFRDS